MQEPPSQAARLPLSTSSSSFSDNVPAGASTPVLQPSAAPPPGAPAQPSIPHGPVPDVETTNWNAVRAIANKYGVQSPARWPQKASHSGTDAADMHEQDQVRLLDLGSDAPIKITARPIEGGRFMYKLQSGSLPAEQEGDSFRSPGRVAFQKDAANLDQSSSQKAGQSKASKTLRASRSIPGLRSRSANGLLWGIGQPSTASSTAQIRSASAKTPSANQPSHTDTPTLLSQPGPSSNQSSVPPPPWKQEPAGQGSVQSGDVLGAILDLPQSAPQQTTLSDQEPTSSSTIAELFPSSSAGSRSFPLRAFGKTVAVDRKDAADKPNALQSPSNTSLLDRTDWNRSPIPQLPNMGDPLFEDLEAFANGSKTGPHSPGARFGSAFEPQSSLLKVPQQQLRAVQSFETTATARPDDGDDETRADGTALSVPLLEPRTEFGDPSKTFLFDVFQTYGKSSASSGPQSVEALTPATSRSASVEDGLSAMSPDASFGEASVSSAQNTSTDAAPADDPRFVLWAFSDSTDSEKLVLSNRDGLSFAQDASARDQIRQSVSTVSSSSSNGPRARPASSLPKRRSSRPADSIPPSPSLNSSQRQRMPSSNSQSSRISVTPSSQSGQTSERPVATRASKASAIAATPARLVAEITGEINSRLMTDFFYTFRAFMSTQDLLDLLIARFHWALNEPTSPTDDARRRIVRVRTYVVIKYWITNFFQVDFLGNRTVRNSLTSWLNELSSDPRLPSRPAEMSIVSSLKKVVRNLKHAYSNSGVGALVRNERTRSASSDQSSGLGHQTLGSPISPTTESRRRNGLPHQRDSDELTDGTPSSKGFNPSTNPMIGVGSYGSPLSSPTSPNNALSRALNSTVGRFSRLKKTMGQRLASQPGDGVHGALAGDATDTGDLLYMRGGVANLIQQFHLDQPAEGEGQAEDPNAGLSDDHGATDETPSLSTSSAMSRSTPASSIDSNHRREAEDDHEDSKAEVEDALGLGICVNDARPPSLAQRDVKQFAAGARHNDSRPTGSQDADRSLGAPLDPIASMATTASPVIGGDDEEMLDRSWNEDTPQESHTRLRSSDAGNSGVVHHVDSDSTLRSFANSAVSGMQTEQRSSVQAPRRARAQTVSSIVVSKRSTESNRSQRQNAVDVVQLDELDSSSDEENGGVRRKLRRLPGVRNLRTANNVQNLRPQRQSLDSLASLGRVFPGGDRTSLASTRMSHRPSPPVTVGRVQTEMFDPDEALAGYELVKGFRVEDFQSDDEEPGDVDEALRRLEGFIDDDKKAERARRVQTLWEQSQARKERREAEQQAADAGDGASEGGAPSSSGHETTAETALAQDQGSMAGAISAASSPTSPRSWLPASITPTEGTPEGTSTPLPNAEGSVGRSSVALGVPSPTVGTPRLPSTGQAAQALMAQRATSASRVRSTAMPFTRRGFLPPHVLNGPAPVHRCFLLSYKSEVIAQQFTLIEAELFKAVDWTELVSDRWRQRRHKTEVLDWESFYQNRVRAKATAAAEGTTYRDTAVEAIIARFNLTCNWVASEVVLTRNMEERVAVISKLIRVAFRCYQYMNFATVVQICLGLQTPWVERLTKTWARVSSRDMRILRDLKALTSPARNFRHLRTAMRGMVEEGSLEDVVTVSGPPQPHHGGGNSTSSSSGGASGGGLPSSTSKGIGVQMHDCCVPFFGLFITDLAVNECLPSLIDPSSPNSAAQVDPSNPSKLLHLQNPDAFAHLQPLPPCIQLEPLVNLFKFRNIAGTVKTVLAFQAKAVNYAFRADAGVYVKCLKIRCLEGRHMTDLSNRLEQ